MEEEGSHAEPGSLSVSIAGSTHTIPQLQPENSELHISPSSAPCSPTPTGTLNRHGPKSPTSPTAASSPSAPGQVSAITVVALLDKLMNMMGAVQENQQRMEQRQADLEGAVRVVQGDVTRLTKAHLSTANSVSKLLERSRKVNCNVKEVKERLDRQAVQVKKLEANHSHLLKRNHFKVIIFQEDNEIPTSVAVKGGGHSPKTPVPSQYDAESTIQPPPSICDSVEGSRTQDDVLQKVSLSSDEDADLACAASHKDDDETLEYEFTPVRFERRSDKFKRSSLKKVDTIKKAFTREKIGEKVTQITSKIVPPEKREKIKKSFTPSHPKSPTARASSFKISPMTFNVKKVRDGDGPAQEMRSPEEGAHVEIPVLAGLDSKMPSGEVRTKEVVVEEVRENLSPPTVETIKAEVSVNGESANVEPEVNGEGLAGLAVPEHDEDVGAEDDEEEEDEEKQKSPKEVAAEVQITAETTAVEQVS
ncbi:PREDICTED: serum deprivation-response protein-like [Cyprinodon variegatus]|uniref:Caveolae associated protein 2a n=1 Tax=Cyprinodon variegatus TaxID=28743 RepID=A0A3Q2DTB5_CYPVA|nr:PREDICTED: serum deprivation-response protein-like [Cyprinodon variegatus]